MVKRAFVASIVAALVIPAGVATAKPPPRTFWGLNYAFYSGLSPIERKRLRLSRVREVRMTIAWNTVEQHKGMFNWTQPDGVIGQLAALGIRPEPLVWGAPLWANGRTLLGAPLDGQTYATPPVTSPSAERHWSAFLTAVVRRYGPNGTFWTGPYANTYPGKAPMPIGSWQIWNEPNIPGAFAPGPDVQKYATLLEIAHNTIVANDPNAKIILAGIPGWVDYPGWDYLNQLYQIPGIKALFDKVAIHPYAQNLHKIKRGVQRYRKVMRKNHDGTTPVWVSEFAWSSAQPDGNLSKGPDGQGELLYKSFKMFAAHRKQWNLSEVSWFNWRDPGNGPKTSGHCSWCVNAGLFTADNKPKPAWYVYQRFTRGLPLGNRFNPNWLRHAPK